MQKYFSFHKGFTLAEVLITLGIIGIVAEMTLPTLMANVQDQIYKDMWEKSYSNISQALMLMKNDNGGDFRGIVGVDEPDIYGHTVYPRLISYLKLLKYNGAAGLYNASSNPVFDYKSLSGTSVRTSLFDDGQMIMSDGAFVAIENAGLSPNWQTIIWVDVNGYVKPPNTIGKDIFGMQLFVDKVVPLGAPGTVCTYLGSVTNTCNTTSGERSGMGCSAEYLK